MPDWKQYVRDNLPPLALGAEREVEMADEMAQHLEAVYEDALADCASEQDAQPCESPHQGLAVARVRIDPLEKAYRRAFDQQSSCARGKDSIAKQKWRTRYGITRTR